jgi:hypothetical protein
LEYTLELWVSVWCRALGVKVVDVYILEFATTATLAHSLDKALRCRCYRTKVNMIT